VKYDFPCTSFTGRSHRRGVRETRRNTNHTVIEALLCAIIPGIIKKGSILIPEHNESRTVWHGPTEDMCAILTSARPLTNRSLLRRISGFVVCLRCRTSKVSASFIAHVRRKGVDVFHHTRATCHSIAQAHDTPFSSQSYDSAPKFCTECLVGYGNASRDLRVLSAVWNLRLII
jgi:hypothetical protein